MSLNLSEGLRKKIEKFSRSIGIEPEKIISGTVKLTLEEYMDFLKQDRSAASESGLGISIPEKTITSKKSTQNQKTQDLQKRLEKYQSLFRSMSQGFYFAEILYDEEGNPCDYRYDEINPAFEKIIQVSSDQLVGKTYNELVAPDPKSGWVDCFKRVASTGVSEHYNFYSEIYKCYFETFAFRPVDGQLAVLVTDVTDQRNAEIALHKSEAELKEAQRIAHLGNWFINQAENYIVWSEELYHINGFEPGQPIPPFTECQKLFSPESWDIFNLALKETGESGIPFEHELEMIRKDGRTGWVLVRGERVTDSLGVIMGFHGIALDITERKKIELELNRYRQNLEALVSERTKKLDQINSDLMNQIAERKRIEIEWANTKILLEQTFEQSPYPMILVSMPDSIIRIINTACQEILGLIDGPSIVGKHVSDLYEVYRDYDSQWKNGIPEKLPLIRSLKGESTSNEERIIVRKDGTIRWVLVSGTPIYNNNEEIMAGYLIFNDITERKRDEDALKISEKNLKEAQKLAKLGYIDWNLTTNNIVWSKETYKIYDYNPDDFSPTIDSIFGMVHAEDKNIVINKLNQALRGEVDYNLEFRAIKSDGGIIYLQSFGEITRDLNGNPVRFMGTVFDITERKKSEEERLRLQNLESLGTLAGGIAHDFNNILTSVLGYVSLLAEGGLDENIKARLISIERATKRAVNLTNQLLTFAKGGKPDKRIISIRKLINDVSGFSLSGSNVKAEFIFSETLNVEADYGQISQVIQNLVINAKQSMPNGGVLIITTVDYSGFKDKKFVKITIQDHGVGVQKEYIDKIFNPYFTTKQTGSGLGLSVCHSIINQHDGKIYVNSEIGVGTTFTILLPATEKEEVMDSKPVKMIDRKLNVLIMDDNEEVRDLLSNMLKNNGHEVLITKDGMEAVMAYRKSKESNSTFDLVFLDLTVIGGMGGKETIKILREYDPDIKAIVSSGYSDTPIASYKEDGFDGMLRKPYTINELNDVIYKIMNK
jgi:PAS domain S-box-containing protein